MIFEKEKQELQDLLLKAQEVQLFNDDNFETINAIFKEYSIIIKKLYQRESNIFGNFYNYGLGEIKDHRNLINKSESLASKCESFSYFKNYLEHSIDSAIEYITD